MKKILMTLAAVLCCAMSTESVFAQTTDWSQYFKVEQLGVRTSVKYTFDFDGENYNGEQMWAGLQNILYVVKYQNPNEDPIDVETKDNRVWFSDAYGRIVHDVPNIKSEWEDFLDDVNWGNAGDFSPVAAFDLARGGEYVFNAIVDFLNIERHDPVTVYDNPTIRIGGDPVVKVGQDVNIMAFFNTGYPYDINSLTGEEYADVTLFKMQSDSTALTLDKQRFSLSKLKDEAHPLLAGIDTVTTKMLKPEPGEYVLRYETNWQAVKTRDFSFIVKDTLRATVTLDKKAYDLATDKQACMKLKMDYGYPHIDAIQPDTIPTIRVVANLLKDIETGECLMADTLTLVSDTLAYKDLNYVGEWNLDWSKIDASKLAEGDSTYQVKVNIKFNNEQQYETIIPVNLKAVITGISPVERQHYDGEAVYTLSGIRKNSRQPFAPGIYLRNGKKIIIK